MTNDKIFVKYLNKIVKFAGKPVTMFIWFVLEGVHWVRVTAGGGAVEDRDFTEEYYKMSQENDMNNNIRLAVFPDSGKLEQVSGIYKYVTKLFSLAGVSSDISQTTTNSQPYLIRKGIKNPNGGNRFMTHPTISFEVGESWSVSVLLNWNGDIDTVNAIAGKSSVTSVLGLRRSSLNQYYYGDDESNRTSVGSTVDLIGRNSLLHFVHDGVQFKIYKNTLLVATFSPQYTSKFKFSSILTGISQGTFLSSKIQAYIIRSGALAATQMTAEDNFFKTYFTEIETTQVGAKHIAIENCEMVATPMGRVINESNLIGDGEIISDIRDREFSENTGWWSKTNGVTIGPLAAAFIGSSDYITRNDMLIANKTYRLRLVSTGTGNLQLLEKDATLIHGTSIITPGTVDLLFKSVLGGPIFVYSNGFSGTIDNISIQEFNFSSASDLYTMTYNQTAGTPNQKHSTALAAAAMWRSPDSDLDKQAVFGKIYNKYAAQLLAFDIAAYNTANPTTPWGYHVMTRTEEQELALLNANNLKAIGTDYWNTANGTNETGLTVLGAGVINSDGTYSNFKANARLMTDSDYVLNIYYNTGVSIEDSVVTQGGSIRLVKD